MTLTAFRTERYGWLPYYVPGWGWVVCFWIDGAVYWEKYPYRQFEFPAGTEFI